MKDFEWIAALIAPRDVGPHANYSDQESITPTQYISAIASLRQPELPANFDGPDPIKAKLSPLELRFSSLIEQAFNQDTTVVGANGLIELANEELQLEIYVAAAAAIAANVVLAEQDRHQEGIVLLERVNEILNQSQGPNTDDKRLLYIIVSSQLLMRQFELGAIDFDITNYWRESQRLLKLCSSISVKNLSAFDTGPGVSWSCRGTYRRVIDEAQFNLRLNQWQQTFGMDARKTRIIRGRTPDLVAEAMRVEAGADSARLREDFDRLVSSSDVTWRSQDPVEVPMWRALVHFEMVGNFSYATSQRLSLGQTRLVRSSFSELPAPAVQDALQLIRHARDQKTYTRALDYVRATGPLEALAAEARTIVSHRLEANVAMSNCDLIGVRVGAQVLSPAEADHAQRVLRSKFELVVRHGPRGSLPATRAELAMQAFESLTSTANTTDQLAEFLMSVSGNFDGGIVSRAAARILDRLDWTHVGTTLRSRWIEWADRDDADADVKSSIVRQLCISQIDENTQAGTIDAVTDRLNRLIENKGEDAHFPDLDQAVALVSEQMKGIAQQAESGVFSVGGIAASDVAVGLCVYAGARSLWPELVAFLIHPIVSRGDKNAALSRLSRHAQQIPKAQVEVLRRELPTLLYAGSPTQIFTGDQIVPYPEALSLCVSLRLLSESNLIAAFNQLVTAPSSSARKSGAKSLQAYLADSDGDVPSWVSVLALMLSHDVDANVRAQAAGLLGGLIDRSEPTIGDVILERLSSLLLADGVLSPLLALRGLTEASLPVPERLRTQVAEMVGRHPARGVRLQAAAALRELEATDT